MGGSNYLHGLLHENHKTLHPFSWLQKCSHEFFCELYKFSLPSLKTIHDRLHFFILISRVSLYRL
jgi:hypothetical protein